MIKIILSILLSSVMFGATPLVTPTGCDLSEDGDISLNIAGYENSKNAEERET